MKPTHEYDEVVYPVRIYTGNFLLGESVFKEYDKACDFYNSLLKGDLKKGIVIEMTKESINFECCVHEEKLSSAEFTNHSKVEVRS